MDEFQTEHHMRTKKGVDVIKTRIIWFDLECITLAYCDNCHTGDCYEMN